MVAQASVFVFCRLTIILSFCLVQKQNHMSVTTFGPGLKANERNKGDSGHRDVCDNIRYIS